MSVFYIIIIYYYLNICSKKYKCSFTATSTILNNSLEQKVFNCLEHLCASSKRFKIKKTIN